VINNNHLLEIIRSCFKKKKIDLWIVTIPISKQEAQMCQNGCFRFLICGAFYCSNVIGCIFFVNSLEKSLSEKSLNQTEHLKIQKKTTP
jgi:hypothetical protein